MCESLRTVPDDDAQWMSEGQLAGGARRRTTFFARAKKVAKESTPRFVALRVPNFSRPVRAAAQLALRAQTVLADIPRTGREKLATQRGCKAVVCNQHEPFNRHWDTTRRQRGFDVPSPLPEPRIFGLAGGAEGRRKLSERSEFFRRPAESKILGVSTAAGRAFFGSFLCTSKERNAPPGASRPTAACSLVNLFYA